MDEPYDLAACVLGLAYLDELLRDILAYRVAKPEAIKLQRWTGSRLIGRAEKLGLIDQGLAAPLSAFVKIRNGFGHVLFRELRDDEVENFVKSVSACTRYEKLSQRLRKPCSPGKKVRVAIMLLREQLQRIEQRQSRDRARPYLRD